MREPASLLGVRPTGIVKAAGELRPYEKTHGWANSTSDERPLTTAKNSCAAARCWTPVAERKSLSGHFRMEMCAGHLLHTRRDPGDPGHINPEELFARKWSSISPEEPNDKLKT